MKKTYKRPHQTPPSPTRPPENHQIKLAIWLRFTVTLLTLRCHFFGDYLALLALRCHICAIFQHCNKAQFSQPNSSKRGPFFKCPRAERAPRGLATFATITTQCKYAPHPSSTRSSILHTKRGSIYGGSVLPFSSHYFFAENIN